MSYSRLWRPGEGNAVNATYTITPTLVNEFTFGKSYSHVYYNVLNPSALTRDKMGNIPQWFTGANYLMSYSRLWRPGEGNAVNATYTITPTLVNEFTFGKSYSHVYYNVLNPSALTRDKMGNIPQWLPAPMA